MTGGQIYEEAESNASLLAVAREPRYINMAVRKKEDGTEFLTHPPSVTGMLPVISMMPARKVQPRDIRCFP